MLDKIGIGTVQFGINYGISNTTGITNSNDVTEILSILKEHHILTLDTAHAYGSSEQVLGDQCLKRFNIITKFINIQNTTELENQLQQSLNHLKTKTLYGYLAHRPFEVIENPEIWEKLIELKRLKIVQKIGFSFSNIDEVEAVLKTGFIPDLIQVPYNYLDTRFEEHMINFKSQYDTEVHTRSTFLQGLFFMNPEDLSAFFDSVKPILRTLTNENLTAQLLQFVLKKSFIDKVIIGVNTPLQLKENIAYSKKTIEDLPKNNFKITSEILTPSNWPK